jgi:hypothetical protein
MKRYSERVVEIHVLKKKQNKGGNKKMEDCEN